MTPDARDQSIARQQRIDVICDRFESAIREGESPRIEDYLTAVASEERGELLKALIGVELELTGDEATNISTYLTRFPNYRAAVRAGFHEAGLSDSVAQDVRAKTTFSIWPQR